MQDRYWIFAENQSVNWLKGSLKNKVFLIFFCLFYDSIWKIVNFSKKFAKNDRKTLFNLPFKNQFLYGISKTRNHLGLRNQTITIKTRVHNFLKWKNISYILIRNFKQLSNCNAFSLSSRKKNKLWQQCIGFARVIKLLFLSCVGINWCRTVMY